MKRKSRRRTPPPAPGPPDTRDDVGAKPDLPTWKKILFAAIVCSTLFAALELLLWAAGVPTQAEREDPFRGFSGLVKVFERHGDTYRTSASVARTFNDQSFLAAKPSNGVRLFCLGGSSSYGYPWGAQAAFTSIVGEALAASRPALRVEAVNASGVSYAMHRMNIVADELLAYQPDIFLVYEGHNEFVEPAFFDAYKLRGAGRTRLEYLLARSRIYSGMRQLLLGAAADRPAAQAGKYEASVRRDQTRVFSPEEKAAIVAEFGARLERLVRRAQAAGVKVLLATVPCNLRQWRPEASTTQAGLSEASRRAWSEAFLAGKRFLEARDNAAAAEFLGRAARLAPEHAETQFLLAQAYDALGRWDEARAAYVLACDHDASPTRRLSGMNDAIRTVARKNGALLVDVDRIFEEHSDHGLVGFNLIEDYVHPTREGHELIAWHVWDAMERAGWFPGGAQAQRAVFDKVVAERRRGPEVSNATWLRNQGVALQNQGRAAAAIEKYREALAVAPGDPVVLLNLGSLLTNAGRAAEAVALLERLVAVDPRSSDGRNNLGIALRRVGRPRDAIKHFEAALALTPERPHLHNNLGNAWRDAGDLAAAIGQFERAVQMRPDYADAHANLGDALMQAGRVPEAIGHYEQVLRIAPNDAEARRSLEIARAMVGGRSAGPTR